MDKIYDNVWTFFNDDKDFQKLEMNTRFEIN